MTADHDSASSADEDASTQHRSPGRPRKSLLASPGSSPEKEVSQAELDAMVARLREEARLETAAATAGASDGGPKKRTYGRSSGGLKKIAALVQEDATAKASSSKLFGSSSLTDLPTSEDRPSSQKTAGTSDTERGEANTTISRPSAGQESSDEDESSEKEEYMFVARRRPRASNPLLTSSSSALASSPPSAQLSSATSSPPPPPPTTTKPTALSKSTTPAVVNPVRPFVPEKSRLTAPLGLGSHDSSLDLGARSASPEISDFSGAGTQKITTAGRAARNEVGESDEEGTVSLIKSQPLPARTALSSTVPSKPIARPLTPPSSHSDSSAEEKEGPSSTSLPPSLKSTAKKTKKHAYEDSDDSDSQQRAASTTRAGLEAMMDSPEKGEDGEPWIGDVVRAIKEKRRGEGSGTSSPPKAKGLSKKELQQMKLEQARMQREQRTTIERPEQETRDMLTFLRRKREAAAARKIQIKPLNTQHFFRDGEPVSSVASASAPPSFKSERATPSPIDPMSMDIDDPSSDPIVSSNPALVPASTRRKDISLDTSEADFEDVDALFAQKRKADEEKLQKEAEERIVAEKKERLRVLKEKAVAAAAAASRAKGKGRVSADSDEDEDDDLEIETLGPATVIKKETTGRQVTAKNDHSTLIHRNLASYGVVHKPRSSDAYSKGRPAARHSRGTSLAPTESQIYAAGTTYGHGSSSPSAAPSKRPAKAHHVRPVTKEDLTLNLLAKASAQRRKVIQEKDAKYGRVERASQKEELDYDRLMEGAQKRKSDWILIAEEQDDDDDDAEDGDFNPGATDAEEEEGEGEKGSGEEGEEEGPADDRPEWDLEPMEPEEDVVDPMAPEPEPAQARTDEEHSDKENSLPLGASRPLSREEDKENRPSSGILADRGDAVVAEDAEDEEESFPMVRTKRRRTVLFDDDEDEASQDSQQPPANALGSPVSKPLSFGAALSPAPSPHVNKFASTASLDEPAFGAASDDAFGGGDGEGFGEGGFSQFFDATQVPTVVSEPTKESQDAQMDLDGEGFSQFFGETQAPAPPKDVTKVGGLQQLRALAHDAPLRPEMSQLPSLDVSESQQEAVANALARDAVPPVAAEPTPHSKRVFINKDGFFTQNEPSTYGMDSPLDETPSRPHQVGSHATPSTPSFQGLQTTAASSSSPAKPIRRLVRRQDRAPASDDERIVDERDEMPPPPPPRPLYRPEKKERDPNKPRRVVNAEVEAEIKAMMENEAFESDEDDGFGAFGKTKASDDEDDDEDQDKIVEGLVNDEQMTQDAQKRADEERDRLNRELAEADDEAQMKIAQDITTGEFRKKKKDALSMEMDSDEENYGTSKRSKEERRRKRKLDKLDEMERIEFDPETAPFAKMYADTYNNDNDEYANLLSDEDDGNGSNSDAIDFAESLGISKNRHHRRRIVASPEPMDPRPSVIRVYDDGSDEEETESQLQIRRGGAHRPQPVPIQTDEEAYSLGLSTGYSNSDNSQKHSQTRRERIQSFARDESQNSSNSRSGATASVTGLKRKPSTSSLNSNSSTKRKVSDLLPGGSNSGSGRSMLHGIGKKWEK